MTQKSFWRGVLLTVLSVALGTQALANKPRLVANFGPSKGAATAILVGIVAVAAIAVLAVVLIVRHKSQQRAITGCINSGVNGMGVTDEKDKRSYILSGDVAGVKTGESNDVGRQAERERQDAGLGSTQGNQGLRRMPALRTVSRSIA